MNKIALLFTMLSSISLGVISSKEKIRKAKYTPPLEAFTELETGFTHIASKEEFPFTGAAVIDLEADGQDELFLSGSKGQKDLLLKYQDGKLIDIAKEKNISSDLSASLGANSFDIDNDGDTDLVISKRDGVWFYLNDHGSFKAKKVFSNTKKDYVTFNVAITDVNKDSLPDLYLSNFIVPENFVTATFNKKEHAKANILLLNKGDFVFEDITEKTGTAGSQNTFLSSFVDLNMDGHLDLVLANNTGEIEIFKNHGDLKFEKTKSNSGLGFWMGIAIGDIDNDGDQDLFFSNVGSTVPEKLLRGDLREEQKLNLAWLLLRNEGDFNFTNTTKEYELDGYGFGWGGVFEDINLDGDLDLLVAQNYINWPGHKFKKLKSKAFLQLNNKEGKAFYDQHKALKLKNAHYAQSPVVLDFDGDAKPDLVWLNMNGPARAFLNNSQNNSLKILVPDNLEYLGANFILETKNGKKYTKQITNNVGFSTDQTTSVFFGLKQDDDIKALHIIKADSTVKSITDLRANTVIHLE